MEQAADDANNGADALPILESLYHRNPNDAGVATRYAHALRETGHVTRASIIIAPFAKDDYKPYAPAKLEFAMIQAALGNYAAASDAARKAVAMDGKSWQAYDVLGIALDAQGDQVNAEKALRTALTLCPVDQQAPILNNLGLNLASQGFLDEAAETLRKALALSPNRSEVERNLRIVSALRESGGRAPSYLQKAHDEALKNEAKIQADIANKSAASPKAAKAEPKKKPDAKAVPKTEPKPKPKPEKKPVSKAVAKPAAKPAAKAEPVKAPPPEDKPHFNE
jgi:Flp pilus assembly protein TadD